MLFQQGMLTPQAMGKSGKLQDPLHGPVLTPGSERELLHQTMCKAQGILPGSSRFIQQQISPHKAAEKSFLKAVFAENSEILNKQKQKRVEQAHEAIFSKSPFLDDADLKTSLKNIDFSSDKKLTVEEEALIKKLETTEAYEVTDTDRKKYLSFLEKNREERVKKEKEEQELKKQIEEQVRKEHEAQFDLLKQQQEKIQELQQQQLQQQELLLEQQKKQQQQQVIQEEAQKRQQQQLEDQKKRITEEKERLFKQKQEQIERQKQALKEKSADSAAIQNGASSILEHSPGDVYTIQEDLDEISSPTAPDGVSRPRRKSKHFKSIKITYQ